MHNISTLIWKEITDNLQYQISPESTEIKGKMYSQQ
jgi:hypothetical protein